MTLEELRNTKITVASLNEETLSQSPVPVSLITADMIRQSGALTLKEVLLAYVPGFSDVEDQNEVNIAARGIYTSSQQKILIMINGHQLNSRSYSMAAPDHSISLEKVQQIEVLRGPAASLYGNVSLTATVNIILKKAEENQGLAVKLVGGDYGQRGLSLGYGYHGESFDSFMWVAGFTADGQTIHLGADEVYTATPLPDNQAILGGITDRTSYDVGVNLSGKNFHLLANSRRTHYIEPFSGAGLTGEPYVYQDYDKVKGYGPGLGYTMNHLDIGREFDVLGWKNKTRIYWDNFEINVPLIINPATPVFAAPHWQDKTLGLFSTSEKNFSNSHLLWGIQYETYKVYGSKLPIGIGSTSITGEVDDMLPSGEESNSSAFAQYKAPFLTNWQANVGLRYDYKNRKKTDNEEQLSPRLGVIYTRGDHDVKLSYSKSFVDATYWNRFSNLASFIGADTLKPETLQTLQITPSFYFPDNKLQLTTNVFYDHAKDVIVRDNSATSNNYSNAGKLESWGVEQELAYISGGFQFRLNASYRQALDSELIQSEDGDIANVPAVSLNMIMDAQLSQNIWLNLSARYVGKQFSPIVIQQDGVKVEDPFPDSGVSFDDPGHYVDSAILINGNLRYSMSDKIEFAIKVSNIFDEEHQQGGSTLHPYQKPGRWFLASASIKF